MTPSAFKTRFAPSPTGLLHLGNIRTALFNCLLARHHQGIFLLRLEDTDAVRGHEKYAEALQEDLAWLGLVWQEGPRAGGDRGPYYQSQRDHLYRQYFDALQQQGLAYRCFCSEHELEVSRKTQLAAGRPPRYSGRCRHLAPAEVEQRLAGGTPATLRFHVADGSVVEFGDRVRGTQTFRTEDIGDFVIRRSDGSPAFFFCNAIDDALMGVTLVMRGEDHLANTPRQILMLRALGLPVPEYAHISLVVGADGSPLSKRHGSRTVRDLRESGYFPQAIVNYLARLGHTYESNSFMDAAALAGQFDSARLGRAPARYDDAQLLHWQHEAILHLPEDDVWRWMGEAVQAAVPVVDRDAFIVAVRGNIATPADALKWARIIFSDDWRPGHDALDIIATAGRGFFDYALAAFDRHGTDFRAFSDELKKTGGVKGKSLFMPLRAALTGEHDGPEMARLLPLIGAERARARLKAAGNK
jgi:glutamyl-tRNA synthetase